MTGSADTSCWNCGDEVNVCNCGDTETYDNQVGPVCPHCGHRHKAEDSEGALYDEGTVEYSCDECSKDFEVGVSVSFAWTAGRIKEEDNEAS